MAKNTKLQPYICSFSGRLLGAIGRSRKFKILIQAANEKDALDRTYLKAEHIMNFHAKPVSRRLPRTPRKADWFDEKTVLREFCAAEGCKPGECSIEADAGLASLHEGTYYTIACGSREYQIARDQDSMRGLAIAIVTQDLNDEPELFNQGWLENHIDTDHLRKELETDLHDSNVEYAKDIGTKRFWKEARDHGIDVPDDVQAALDAGDEPRDPNASELDAFADDMTNDQLKDPMSYLRDIYGGDAAKEAIRIAGIDVDAAAEDAVDTDGPEHFVGHYDGKSHETKSHFVYWRTN
jgi:hypothetical protein